MFKDKESITNLVKKYSGKNESEARELASEIKNEANSIPDKEFAHIIINIDNKKIKKKFYESYKEWRKHISQRVNQAILTSIEELYPSGKLKLEITDIKGMLVIYTSIVFSSFDIVF